MGVRTKDNIMLRCKLSWHDIDFLISNKRPQLSVVHAP